MKAKVLLGSLGLSLCFVAAYQTQVKPTVLAETKESVSLQQETTISSTESRPVISSGGSEESVVTEESSVSSEASSIEETRNSEGTESEKSKAEETDTSTVATIQTELAAEKAAVETSVPTTEAAKVQAPLPAAKVEENFQFSVTKNQTTSEFIQSIGADAQQIAWDKGLYASVMIAQAILETGSGNSQLARPPHHNLFGIKGSYQGKNVSFNTQEDKGNGQLYTIQSAFRQYPSYKESLEDYANLLKNGLSGNPGFYQATWKENAATYREATKALTGKYATDTSYDKKLNALIETYELTTFDGEPKKVEETTESSDTEKLSESTEVIKDSPSSSSEVSSESTETEVRVAKTKQKVVVIPSAAQRPAKQLTGNRTAQ